jgi:prepilin-type N-terminal cleavage/methylation domain-containing protein
MSRNQARIESHQEWQTRAGQTGFTLIEMLVALIILSFGLLAGGQLTCLALKSRTLARSKALAAIAAQSKIEFLSDRYQADPDNPEVQNGAHGREVVTVMDPGVNTDLNRFAISWELTYVEDPRPGKVLRARKIAVTVTPIGMGDEVNLKAWQNKAVSVTSVFSLRENH